MKFPGNLQELLQQAAKLQQNVSQLQAELEAKVVEGNAGGGMVRVLFNGAFKVREVKIEPALLGQNDPQLVEDLLESAINDALRKCKEMLKEEIVKRTGRLPIPGLM